MVILSKEQAIDIYSMRSPETTRDAALKVNMHCFTKREAPVSSGANLPHPTVQTVAGKSSMVAEMYGVSPKTVTAPLHPLSSDRPWLH